MQHALINYMKRSIKLCFIVLLIAVNCYLSKYWLVESSCFSRDCNAFLGDLEKDKPYMQNVTIYVAKLIDVRLKFLSGTRIRRIQLCFCEEDFIFLKRFDRRLSNLRSWWQRSVMMTSKRPLRQVSVREMLGNIQLDEPDSAAMLTEYGPNLHLCH